MCGLLVDRFRRGWLPRRRRSAAPFGTGALSGHGIGENPPGRAVKTLSRGKGVRKQACLSGAAADFIVPMSPRPIVRWKRAGWNEFVLFGSIALVCVCVGVFLELASSFADESHRAMDERLMRAFRDPSDLSRAAGAVWWVELARNVSALGSAFVVTTLALLVAGYCALRGQGSRVVLIVVAVGGGYLLGNTLKAGYGRERPDVVPHLSQVTSASFPSTHAMASATIYLTLGGLLAHASLRRREKIYFILTAFLLTFLVGLSRVFLGVHYPSDVVAGWSAGTAWAVCCWLVWTRFEAR